MWHHETHAPDSDLYIPEVSGVEIEPYDFREHDIYGTMLSLVPALVEKACYGAKYYTASYRGFCVGAAAVAYDTAPENPRLGIYTAGNFKAKLDDEERTEEDVLDIPKFCAEMDINMRATNDDFLRIGLIVVAATTKVERIKEVTHVESATLHPCRDCQVVMQGSDLIDRSTVIMTVGSGKDIYQVQSLDKLRSRYRQYDNTGTFKDAETHRYRIADWADRQTYYDQEVRRRRIKGTVYQANPSKEVKRRQLMLEAMVA